MNNLIISTGSNIGERVEFLQNALDILSKEFTLVQKSNVYESPAVDYLNQPDFLNQVLHFHTTYSSPDLVLEKTMEIEKDFGRKRNIDKGPRTLDIDLLFWNLETVKNDNLEIPHPRLFQRSFIVKPLSELKYFSNLREKFKFPTEFDNSCWVLGETKT